MHRISRIDRIGYGLAYCALIWMGFALALYTLDSFPLREDEAIYSFWALHGWRVDPFFLTVWPDKPPLFLGLLALAFQFFGASQASGRFLNSMLTVLTALVIGATARRLWNTRSGFVATALYLLNPFVLSFAPTLYTDPMLVLAGQLALWLALTGRRLGAGFWLGVALMTKQQGVLYAPLLMVVLGTQRLGPRTGQPAQPFSHWSRFAAGVLLVLAPVFYWDSRRWAVAPSPWDLSVRNYGALHLVPPAQWLARSDEWAALLWYFTASWLVWLVWGIMVGSALYRRGSKICTPSIRNSAIWWLGLWGSGFLIFHVVTSVQLWDRYLLPLAPLFCLLAAWAFHQVDNGFLQRIAVRRSVIGGLISLCLLTPPALAAARGALPIGGDHGGYSGLTEAIAWLKREAPAGSILYHQRLGWHYQFYLYDELAAGRIALRWFATPTYLAANAAQTPTSPRYLVLPHWAPQPALPLQLAVHRIDLKPLAHFRQMTLYTLQNQAVFGRPRGCTWCLCKVHLPWSRWSSHDRQRGAVQP